MFPDVTALKFMFLAVTGFSAGAVIAAGIFAFLVIIGVYPRIIGKTETKGKILLYGAVIVLGGTAGNLLDLFEFSAAIPAGTAILCAVGLTVGIFVGCLFMSLAETVKALPVVSRRLKLSVGLQYIVLSIALGKFAGAWVYFACGIG